MKTLIRLLTSAFLLLTLASCATQPLATGTVNFNLTPQQKQIAADVSAEASNAVIDAGLTKAAAYAADLNPHVHSVAAGIYANAAAIVSEADMIKIAQDYGDPKQPEKFKTLGRNLWTIAKREAGPLALRTLLKYVGYGAQTGQLPAETKQTMTVSTVAK